MEGLQRGDPASVGGYQLLGRLGAGGMGQVFLGVSPSGRRVAVKLIHPMHAGTEQFRERFAREIEAARRVGGFHTAPVVDADPQADPPWMVTAYIDGPSLQEAVGRYGPLPPARVRALGAGLAEGLAAIHAHGLIHRDLKPGNVIVAEDGPRIIDFGIARAVDSTGLTSTGTVVGTFSYMSPEQVRGDPVMPASDVFSLGCVLGFAATGRPPFGSDTAATVVFRIVTQPPDLAGLADQELGTLIQACLAKSPEDRPAVRAVLTALTGRGPLPAVASRAPGGPVPAADGRDAHTQTQTPLRVSAGTNSWGEALPAPSTAPPGPAPPGPARPRPARRCPASDRPTRPAGARSPRRRPAPSPPRRARRRGSRSRRARRRRSRPADQGHPASGGRPRSGQRISRYELGHHARPERPGHDPRPEQRGHHTRRERPRPGVQPGQHHPGAQSHPARPESWGYRVQPGRQAPGRRWRPRTARMGCHYRSAHHHPRRPRWQPSVCRGVQPERQAPDRRRR